jgi:beta-lactamase class D
MTARLFTTVAILGTGNARIKGPFDKFWLEICMQIKEKSPQLFCVNLKRGQNYLLAKFLKKVSLI